MGKERRTLLEKVFPLDGVGWRLPSFIAAIVTVAVAGGAVWVWFREQAGDVLTTEVAVWRVLVAVGGVLVLTVAGLWALVAGDHAVVISSSRSSPAKPDRPREIEHFGVKWPIDWPYGSSASVGKPTCPLDRSTLPTALPRART